MDRDLEATYGDDERREAPSLLVSPSERSRSIRQSAHAASAEASIEAIDAIEEALSAAAPYPLEPERPANARTVSEFGRAELAELDAESALLDEVGAEVAALRRENAELRSRDPLAGLERAADLETELDDLRRRLEETRATNAELLDASEARVKREAALVDEARAPRAPPRRERTSSGASRGAPRTDRADLERRLEAAAAARAAEQDKNAAATADLKRLGELSANAEARASSRSSRRRRARPTRCSATSRAERDARTLDAQLDDARAAAARPERGDAATQTEAPAAAASPTPRRRCRPRVRQIPFPAAVFPPEAPAAPRAPPLGAAPADLPARAARSPHAAPAPRRRRDAGARRPAPRRRARGPAGARGPPAPATTEEALAAQLDAAARARDARAAAAAPAPAGRGRRRRAAADEPPARRYEDLPAHLRRPTIKPTGQCPRCWRPRPCARDDAAAASTARAP
ncbi:hypothetical protein JL721_1120 [Aureococcus anophagefferens]|nr:hypothetical protein JL721_1120 [Aureococcus anophagefferens]